MTAYYKVQAYIPAEHYDALLDWLTERKVQMHIEFPFSRELGGFTPAFAASASVPSPSATPGKDTFR